MWSRTCIASNARVILCEKSSVGSESNFSQNRHSDSFFSASCKYVDIMISSLSCIPLRADRSACVKLSVFGICTSTLCLISDLMRWMTDSSLVFWLGFGIQLIFLTNLGISMTSFMSDSSVDRSSLVSFFQWKYSLILSRRANWSRSSSSSRTFILFIYIYIYDKVC